MSTLSLTDEESAHECKAIPTFRFRDGTVIQFFASDDVPGYSHFVVLNGRRTGRWLGSSFKPGKAAAKFYYHELVVQAAAR